MLFHISGEELNADAIEYLGECDVRVMLRVQHTIRSVRALPPAQDEVHMTMAEAVASRLL